MNSQSSYIRSWQYKHCCFMSSIIARIFIILLYTKSYCSVVQNSNQGKSERMVKGERSVCQKRVSYDLVYQKLI